MTSCNSNDDPAPFVTEQSLLSCYAYVIDSQNPASPTICTPMTIKLTLDWSNEKAETQISGLKIGNSTYPVITLNTGWKVEEGWGKIESESVVATSEMGVSYTLSQFELEWLDRLDLVETLGGYAPACAFEFIIDGRYKVVGSRQPMVMAGKTKSTPQNGTTFETDKSLYSVQLDFVSMTAKITIANAKFIDFMPGNITIEFPDIPFTFAENGTKIILQKDVLTPTSGGRPFDRFPINNLYAEIEPENGMDLNFICKYADKEGNKTTYTVVADLDYTSYQPVINNAGGL